MRYFLYARKSTDTEDKQVLSIQSQLTEVREYAEKNNLNVIREFQEARTAKAPGRPVFNEMIRLIEQGKAEGIITWHPDRLARNSIDGGKIIYLIDTGKITDLAFPTYRFDNNAQRKFMLNIIFGQSKYYVDNLSENTKRGMREKLRLGEYPGYAPLGYKNNVIDHSIDIVPEIAQKVKVLFELYATGRYSMDEIRKLATASGLASRRKQTQLSISNIERLLKNPFYYGAFLFNGELYEGTHPPIISKELFDKAQVALSLRSKPRKNGPHFHTFRGFIRCAQCNCSITSEIQKQRYVYYHCTRKRQECRQPFLREEALVHQISNAIAKVSIDEKMKKFFLGKINEESSAVSPTPSSVLAINNRIGEIDKQLNILLDAYINQVISEAEYKRKKSILLNEKIELRDRKTNLDGKDKVWLELARNFITSAGQASYIATEGTLEEKRVFLEKIGSNFRLSGAKLFFEYKLPYSFLVKKPQKKEWGG